MTKSKLKTELSILIILAIFCMPYLALAQDPGGGPDVPIDGGLTLLIAAGAAYGVKKYRDGRKKQNEDAGQDLK